MFKIVMIIKHNKTPQQDREWTDLFQLSAIVCV